jgi:hypothetical protein
MTPEGRVKALVKRLFEKMEEQGDKVYRFMPVQSGYGSVGLDFYVCYRGKFIAVETKKRGKTMTPRQQLTQAEIEAAGGVVFTVRSDEDLVPLAAYMLSLRDGTPWTK